MSIECVTVPLIRGKKAAKKGKKRISVAEV
jgi:hypothetical protein